MHLIYVVVEINPPLFIFNFRIKWIFFSLPVQNEKNIFLSKDV